MSAPDDVEAEFKAWRDRLAAASRNVSELSELPEYGAVRAIAAGAGRLAEEARGLVATMDELWQGVLLIGGALDRAERTRGGGGRLWRSDALGEDALQILRGPSITVDLAETPVLHRRLLGGPRTTAAVSPETLLRTMDAAFDRAREQLARITDTAAEAAALKARLAAVVGRLPATTGLAARLAAADAPIQADGQPRDPLDRLDALQALAPVVDAAAQAFDKARSGVEAAQRAMTALRAEADRADAAAAASTAAVAARLPAADPGAPRELAAWLDRIGRTLAAGRTDATLLGLANWQALHERVAADVRSRGDAASAALARRDELRARLGALRAKHRARADPAAASPSLDERAAAARATLATTPLDLDQAARDLAAFEAALAGR